MPVNWDADAYAKLLQAILQLDTVKVDNVKVAEKMKDMGIECTPKAVSHKIVAFRNGTGLVGRVTGKRPAENGDDDAGDELIETPTKKKRASPKKKSTPKKSLEIKEGPVNENVNLQLTPKKEEVKEELNKDGMSNHNE